MNLTIAIVDPVPYTIQYTRRYFVSLMIASYRKILNLQSLESCNQNPTYSIMMMYVSHVSSGTSFLVQC